MHHSHSKDTSEIVKALRPLSERTVLVIIATIIIIIIIIVVITIIVIVLVDRVEETEDRLKETVCHGRVFLSFAPPTPCLCGVGVCVVASV